MTARDFETLVSIYSKMGYTERDLRDKIGCSWVLAYKLGKSLEKRSGDFSCRYRAKLRNLPVTARKKLRSESHKSGVLSIEFNKCVL